MRITLLVDGHCVRVDGPFRVIRFDGDPYVVGAGQMFYCESPEAGASALRPAATSAGTKNP